MVGDLAALGSAATWAFVSVVLKRPVLEMGAVWVNTLRTWVGALVFLGLLAASGRAGDLLMLSPYTVFALVLSMIVGLGLGDTLYFHSLRFIDVSRALPISGSYPLPTLVIAVLWLGEPVSLRQAIGTLLVVASIYLITLPSEVAKAQPLARRDQRRGVLLAVAAALAWATATTLLKSGVADTDLVVANSLRLPAAGLALLPMALRQTGGLRLRGVRAGTLAIVLVSGVLGTALGSALYVTAVVLAGAAKTAALQSIAPFVAAPLAFLFLGERLARATLVGTLVSVLGVWLVIGG